MGTDQSIEELTGKVADLESAMGEVVRRLMALESSLASPPATSAVPADLGRSETLVTPRTPPPPDVSPSPISVPPPPTLASQPPPRPGEWAQPQSGPQPVAEKTGSSAGAPSLERLLRWTGIALVGLAALFLVSTAVSRGWIGPRLQLAGAAAIGAALMGVAHRLRQLPLWPPTLAAGGASILTFSAAAGYSWLELYGPLAALGLIAAATVAAVILAADLKNEAAALASTVTLLVVPTWVGIISNAPVTVVGLWLGLFALFAAAVGLWARWSWYRLVSTWAAAIWTGGLVAMLDSDLTTTVLACGLIGLLAIVLWLNPSLSSRFGIDSGTAKADGSSDPETKNRPFIDVFATERASVAALPLWLFGSISAAVSGVVDWTSREYGLLGFGLAVGLLVLTAATKTVNDRLHRSIAVLHLLGAGTLATLSLLAWIEGPQLPVVLAAQALATLVASAYSDARLLRFQAWAIAALSALILLPELDASATANEIRPGHSLAQLVTIGFWAMMAALVHRRNGLDRAAPFHGMVTAAIAVFIAATIAPLVQNVAVQAWLPVGVGFTVAANAAATRLGRHVRDVAGAVGLGTVLGTGVGLQQAIENGVGELWWVHLAHLLVVAAVGYFTFERWSDRTWNLRGIAFIGTWILALAWLTSVLIELPQGQVAISVVWAAAALGAIAAGFRFGESIMRTTGLVTLAMVMVKLLTFDLAAVDTLWRVLLFLIVGLGFLRLAYVLPKLADDNLESKADGSLESKV